MKLTQSTRTVAIDTGEMMQGMEPLVPGYWLPKFAEDTFLEQYLVGTIDAGIDAILISDRIDRTIDMYQEHRKSLLTGDRNYRRLGRQLRLRSGDPVPEGEILFMDMEELEIRDEEVYQETQKRLRCLPVNIISDLPPVDDLTIQYTSNDGAVQGTYNRRWLALYQVEDRMAIISSQELPVAMHPVAASSELPDVTTVERAGLYEAVRAGMNRKEQIIKYYVPYKEIPDFDTSEEVAIEDGRKIRVLSRILDVVRL